MLLNRSHLPWAWFTLLATLIAGGVYLLVFHPDTVPVRVDLPRWLGNSHRLHQSVGNSPLGLLYGSISFAIFIFAVLLNARRKIPQAPLGRAQTWLRAHIWLTILTLPLVFMHAAFHFGGMMTSALMWLYLLVMLSGFYGLALQQFLPGLLKTRLTLETIYDEIPFLSQQMLQSALKIRDDLRSTPTLLAETAPGTAGRSANASAFSAAPMSALAEGEPPDASVPTILEALEHEILPYLASRETKRNRLAKAQFSANFSRQLRVRVAPAYYPIVDQLALWVEERRQMDLQVHFHRWLHGWLFVHVPASFLLIILTGWHAVVTLFVY